MAENPLTRGVGALGRLPPVALVGIAVVGIGGVLYFRSRSKPAQVVPTYQAEQLVALERGPVGALPSTIGPAQPTTVTVDEQIVSPRADARPSGVFQPLQPAAPASPVTPTAPAQPVQPTRQVPVSGGQGTPISQVPPAQPVQPPPTEVRDQAWLEQHTYPGYGLDYQIDCARAFGYTGFLTTWEGVVNQIKSKGLNSVMTNRQLAQIAVGGFPKDEAIRWNELGRVIGGAPNRVWINNNRVFSGLQPLSVVEFDQMQAHMRSLWDGSGEPSAAYAKALFDRWNRPYQCGQGPGARRESVR